MANPHRNRTLVLNNKPGAPSTLQPATNIVSPKFEDGVEPTQTANGWVTKRDRHMQLINTSVYDKETLARNKAIEETRKQKSLRRDQREKQKIERHVNALPSHAGRGASTAAVHEIAINGLRFQIIDAGSKLARIRGEGNSEGQSIYSRSRL